MSGNGEIAIASSNFDLPVPCGPISTFTRKLVLAELLYMLSEMVLKLLKVDSKACKFRNKAEGYNTRSRVG